MKGRDRNVVKARISRRPTGPLDRLALPVLLATALLISLQWLTSGQATAQEGDDSFTFVVAADMREYAGSGYDSSDYFRGAVEAIDVVGKGAFMISPGDIDPPGNVLWTITRTLGVAYPWYPVVGNHELPCNPSDSNCNEDHSGDIMNWLNSYDYGTVNVGPSGCPTSTYSFDYRNTHFVVLNEYCDVSGDDVTEGDITDHLYEWIAGDLSSTDKVHIFVFGHEPAFPQPDVDSWEARNMQSSLNAYSTNRDSFWTLLRNEGVAAYFCGHTHNYSAINIDGVWQVDVGHSRGKGDGGQDVESASTFVMVRVDGDIVTFETYRDEHDGDYDYVDIIHTGALAPGPTLVSFQDGVLPTVAYTGTQDSHIASSAPDASFGVSTTLMADGEPDDLAAILRWDVSSLPPGTAVQAASVTVSVTNPSEDVYELYEVKRDWVETEATWANPWQQPGAQGSGDRGADVLGMISARVTGSYVINLNDSGIALVQRWVDDPPTNFGVIVADYGAHDSVQFDSREASSAISRPKLSLLALVSPYSALVIGTTTGPIHTSIPFGVIVSPVTATLPITYEWRATDQAPVVHASSTSLTDTQSFTWTVSGSKVITAMATNAGGTITDAHTVTIYAAVRAAFDAVPTSGSVPLEVAFTNVSGGSYSTSVWDFGDNVTSTLENPTHVYVVPGSYTVTLTVSGMGGTDSISHTNYVSAYASVQAAFDAAPTSGAVPLEVAFTNASGGSYITSVWDFGDNVTSTLENPTHVYTVPGAYTVTLTVSGIGGTDSISRTSYINAHTSVQAAFDAAPTSGAVPLEVVFTNMSSGDYNTSLWGFGDDTNSTLENPTHVYTIPGVYTVTLTVSGPGGTDFISRTSYINAHTSVQAAFDAMPTSGAVPLEVVFTNTSSGDYNATVWYFGDNTTSALANPTHVYTIPGIYTVTLNVSGPGGSDSEAKAGYITVGATTVDHRLYLPFITRDRGGAAVPRKKPPRRSE